MKEFTIGKNDAGQRLDRWLGKNLPLLPAGLAQKYIRIKRVKLNGKGTKRDTRLQVGDVLQLYINDEFFETPTPENAFLKLFKPRLDIVYEDENLLQQTLEAFYWIRDLDEIEKKPSTSELVDWIHALSLSGIPHEDIVKKIPFAGVLLKKDRDLELLQQHL